MADRSVGVILTRHFLWHNFTMALTKNLPRAIGTYLAYKAANDLYHGAKRMVFRRPRAYYALPSRRMGSRVRYRYRRARRGRYRRRYKRAKYARRARIGMPIGYGTTKRALVFNEAASSYNTRTLYSYDLTYIDRTSTLEMDHRNRDIINLRGFKIDYAMLINTVATRPVMVHYAVLCHIGTTSVPSSAQANPLSSTNFFRGSGSSRAIDFSAATLSSLQMNTLNINSDIYVVLKRWTHRLEYTVSAATNISNNSKQTVKIGHKYIPVKRQVRYDDPTDGDVATTGRCFLVWWADYTNGIAAGGTAVSGALSMDHHVVTYFREPSNC